MIRQSVRARIHEGISSPGTCEFATKCSSFVVVCFWVFHEKVTNIFYRVLTYVSLLLWILFPIIYIEQFVL